ncbi:MAG: hypothetical protein EOP83_20425 [Verrucomicrobiaceae bacterium]|nr:MAG: hypothetical protein EOP83_20425 [Verrucomicrobiaceae bacterium]
MNDIKFHCPNCKGSICAGPEWFGKTTGCPHCKRLIDIPLPPKAIPTPEPPSETQGRRTSRAATFIGERKPFIMTLCALVAAFLGLHVYLHTRPEPEVARIVTPVISDDPFVLSNGYRMQRIYRTDANGNLREFTDRESLEAWDRQQEDLGGRASGSHVGECSACNGTGRNIGRTVSDCPGCSGQGTRLTPSGHRIVCSSCEGTGNARQDASCIYCGGSGRVR